MISTGGLRANDYGAYFRHPRAAGQWIIKTPNIYWILISTFGILLFMELRHLRYFVAVAEELHFGRAAKKLNIAQPPLSQQIRGLETELGFQLFYRTKRRVELTDAGRIFLQEARLTLEQAKQTTRAAERASRGETGHLSIGITPTTSYAACPKIVKLFRTRFPHVDLTLKQLSSLDQFQALSRREIHVGFVHIGFPRPPINPGIEVRTIARERWVVALPEDHRLSGLSCIPLRELAAEPFILFPRHTRPELFDQIISSCQKAGFSPNIVQEAYPPQIAIGLVSAGIALSLVSSSLQNIRLPGVVYRPLSDTIPAGEIVVAWRQDDSSPTVRALLQIVDETAPSRSILASRNAQS